MDLRTSNETLSGFSQVMRESFTSRHKHIKLMSCFSYHRVESLLWRGSGWNGHFFRGGVKKSWKNHEIMKIHGKIMETPTQNQLFSLPNPIPNQDTIDFAKFVGSPAGSGKKGEEKTGLESADRSQENTVLAVIVFVGAVGFSTLYVVKTNRWPFCWGFPLLRISHQATGREMLGALSSIR